MTKMFRVPFDRNRYSVPSRLASQQVIVRADDDFVSIFLGTKQVAQHRRVWDIGQDIEHPSHKQDLLEQNPRARRRAAASAHRARRNRTRLLQGARRRLPVRASRRPSGSPSSSRSSAPSPPSAIDEVMHTGHVGAEYVEYVMRHKRGLVPHPPPCASATTSSMPSLCPSPTSPSTTSSRPPLTRDPGDLRSTAEPHEGATT